MEKVNTVKTTVLTIVGVVGSFITNLLGGWTSDMQTLLILMGIDIVMGLLIAGFWKKSDKSPTGTINSLSMAKGLVRKGVYLLIILVAYRLDLSLNADYIRTAVIIAFIVNEVISIIENAGIMGVPIPKVITRAVEVLRNKSEGDGND
jgi:toxin secretion/phage lysis holin